MTKALSPTDLLFEDFLKKAQVIGSIEPIKVLKTRTYKMLDAHVLIRAASVGRNQGYFFGINYINLEEIANLDNPFIAFVCGSIGQTVIMPATVFIQNLSSISHDRNGGSLPLESRCQTLYT